MTITFHIDLDAEGGREQFQRFAHVDAMCSILWRLLHGLPDERLTTPEDAERLCRLLEADGVVIEDIWS